MIWHDGYCVYRDLVKVVGSIHIHDTFLYYFIYYPRKCRKQPLDSKDNNIREAECTTRIH